MNLLSLFGNRTGQSRESLFSFDAKTCGIRRIIGVALGVNLNSVGDTAFTIPGLQTTQSFLALLPGCNFIVTALFANNASVSLTTAQAALYTAVAAGGTNLAAAQALTGLTVPTSNLSLTLAAAAGTTVLNQTTAPTLYLRNTTAQGAAATADFYLEALVLP
jgi:hypothetical protein